MKCPVCNMGDLEKKRVKEEQLGVYLGEYEGLECNCCKESFFDEETTKKILEKSKEKGIFGLEAKTKVSRSGNSLAIRIPKKIAEFLHLKEGKEVRISPRENKLIIES